MNTIQFKVEIYKDDIDKLVINTNYPCENLLEKYTTDISGLCEVFNDLFDRQIDFLEDFYFTGDVENNVEHWTLNLEDHEGITLRVTTDFDIEKIHNQYYCIHVVF
ncbi:hypothetical protein N9043_01970 [bacterium]|nr:hypothetical protein [bacterium]